MILRFFIRNVSFFCRFQQLHVKIQGTFSFPQETHSLDPFSSVHVWHMSVTVKTAPSSHVRRVECGAKNQHAQRPVQNQETFHSPPGQHSMKLITMTVRWHITVMMGQQEPSHVRAMGLGLRNQPVQQCVQLWDLSHSQQCSTVPPMLLGLGWGTVAMMEEEKLSCACLMDTGVKKQHAQILFLSNNPSKTKCG